MWGGRLKFCAVFLILLAALPFTAPFRTCGGPLVPEAARPSANDPDSTSQIGSPVERIVRRAVPLALLRAFDVPVAARLVALDRHPIVARDHLHTFPHTTVLRI